MFNTLWHAVFYDPIYNLLVFLTNVAPAHSIAFGVILLTVLVKIVLYPLTKRALVSQMSMKKIEPELAAMKAETPDKQEQAKKTMEIYKKHKINPLSGCFSILVQLPFIIALYQVFLHEFTLDPDKLYSFIKYPSAVSSQFLGMDLAAHSIVLAVLAGITQFLIAWISDYRMKPAASANGASFSGTFAKSMQMQMKYVLPLFIAFISYQVAGAVALYWVTSNVVTIGIELYLKKKLNK